LEQSLDSTFESAFVTGILKGSSMKLTLVKYVESKSALYGAGVDCEYFVEAKDTNPEELTSVVRSSAVTDAMITSLQGAGYKEATCSAQAIIVDVSPTSAPTYTPTYSKAYVEVKQHVDGVSVADAESQPFASAVQEAIAGSLQIPEEDVFFQGAEEQGGSGVQITYVVALRNTDVNTLRRPLESTHTSSALTSALKLSGFDSASAQPVADVLDVSPTSAPTPFQTLAMVALKAKQAIYGVTYTQANTETFSGAFKAGVAAALGIDDDAVVVESVEGTPLSATIVYVTFDVYQEKADFDGVETKLQSEAARETLGKTLIAATGYAITMPLPCEATDYSPTPVPTARPTNKITVLKVRVSCCSMCGVYVVWCGVGRGWDTRRGCMCSSLRPSLYLRSFQRMCGDMCDVVRWCNGWTASRKTRSRRTKPPSTRRSSTASWPPGTSPSTPSRSRPWSKRGSARTPWT
jgi:hypothetical protein